MRDAVGIAGAFGPGVLLGSEMFVSVFKVVEGLRTKGRAESRARTRVAATRRPRRTTARR